MFDVSARLREFGWLVPAYTFPKNREDLSVLRVVVRAGLTNDMADLFLADMRKQTEWLESLEGPMPKRRVSGRASGTDRVFSREDSEQAATRIALAAETAALRWISAIKSRQGARP